MTARYHEVLGYDTLDIMVDIDDVIVPWFETVDARCAQAFDPNGLKGPCEVWSMYEHYGVTREDWELVVIAAKDDGLYTTTAPLPGAVEAINRLRWYGHRVHIVTARGFFADGENIRRWTEEYLTNFAIGHDTLTFAKDKVQAMHDLGVVFDFAIDDGVHNFENLAQAGVPTYLHDAPHNRSFQTTARVDSLWEFANVVLERTRWASQKPVPVS